MLQLRFWPHDAPNASDVKSLVASWTTSLIGCSAGVPEMGASRLKLAAKLAPGAIEVAGRLDHPRRDPRREVLEQGIKNALVLMDGDERA